MDEDEVVVTYVDPRSKDRLTHEGADLVAPTGERYPVRGGVPVLFVDLVNGFRTAASAEALDELAHYNQVASVAAGDGSYDAIELDRLMSIRSRPPLGDLVWVDSTYDSLAQQSAYEYLGDQEGRCFLQLGGSGLHAAKALLAGAAHAELLTPMEQEARCFLALAARIGASHRARAAVGIAEELPFEPQTFDSIVSGGCLHHTQVHRAIEEAHRVLIAGGRFAAWDPWEAPLHGLGTRVLGKRDPNVNCRPLSADRLDRVGRLIRVRRFSPVARYALLASWKGGIKISLHRAHGLVSLEDRVLTRLGWGGAGGSSVVVLMEADESSTSASAPLRPASTDARGARTRG